MSDSHPVPGEHCLNCDALLTGVFCATCGQRADTGRLDFLDVVRDVTSGILNFDSSILRTVVGLTRTPGQVAKEYVRGRRARYVAPFRYCVAVIALLLVIAAAGGIDIEQSIRDVSGEETPESMKALSLQLAAFVLRNLNYILFAVLPIYALIVRILFRRSPYNYAEVSAFVLFVMGHLILLGLLLTPLRTVAPDAFMATKILFHFLFFSWAAIRFFEVHPVVGILKSAIATMLYFLVVAIVIVAFNLGAIVDAVVAMRPSGP